MYCVESEPGHVVKMKETFHVTSIPCDRWPIFFSFEWMKKTGIWPFYDRNRRSGTLEEESAFEKEGMDRFPCFGAMGGLKKKDLTARELVDEARLEEHLVLEKEMLSERKEHWISINEEEIEQVEAPIIAVSVEDTRDEVEAIWKEVTNASVKEKAIAWKVVLENDLLSKVEIADDFPLRDETALILLRFREQFRMTVGAEAMRIEPHTASYKSTVSDISLYGPRSYNKANTEFLRTRLADFEARGLIKKG